MGHAATKVIDLEYDSAQDVVILWKAQNCIEVDADQFEAFLKEGEYLDEYANGHTGRFSTSYGNWLPAEPTGRMSLSEWFDGTTFKDQLAAAQLYADNL